MADWQRDGEEPQARQSGVAAGGFYMTNPSKCPRCGERYGRSIELVRRGKFLLCPVCGWPYSGEEPQGEGTQTVRRGDAKMTFLSRLRRRLLDLLSVLAAVTWFLLFWLVKKTVRHKSSSRPQGPVKKNVTLSQNRTFGKGKLPPIEIGGFP